MIYTNGRFWPARHKYYISTPLPTRHRLRSHGIETCHTTKYRNGLATTCGRPKYGLRPLWTEWDWFTDGKHGRKESWLFHLFRLHGERCFVHWLQSLMLSRLMRNGPRARRASFRKTGNQTHVLHSFSVCCHQQRVTYLGNGRSFEAVFCILFKTNSFLLWWKISFRIIKNIVKWCIKAVANVHFVNFLVRLLFKCGFKAGPPPWFEFLVIFDFFAPWHRGGREASSVKIL